jgi:ribosomal protein L37AE/L43A
MMKKHLARMLASLVNVSVQLLVSHVSYARVCPRCGSRLISRPRRLFYLCDACQRSFVGCRIGRVRVAL